MAEKKVTAAKAAEVKPAAKTEETKTAAASAPKAVVETKLAETAAKVEAKVGETKTAAKKAVAKTAANSTPKKRGPKPGSKKAVKDEMKPEIIIQYQGNEASMEEVIEKAKAEFVAAGHRMSSIKSLQVYFKPEDAAAYYVVNQKFAGKVDLF